MPAPVGGGVTFLSVSVVVVVSIATSLSRPDAGWRLTLYPDAREAVCQFVPSLRPERVYVPRGSAADPERSRAESARRAHGRVRRYCAANGLDRLFTLTYAGDGCHDPDRLRGDVGEFFRSLRQSEGAKTFPYLWVPEWHPGGHGLHVHFGLGQYVHKSKISAAWCRGFVEARRLSVPHGVGKVGGGRRAAAYLGKYISKTFDESQGFGRHRYEVAQGFTPRAVRWVGNREHDLVSAACDSMGGAPLEVWSSDGEATWRATPTRTLRW